MITVKRLNLILEKFVSLYDEDTSSVYVFTGKHGVLIKIGSFALSNAEKRSINLNKLREITLLFEEDEVENFIEILYSFCSNRHNYYIDHRAFITESDLDSGKDHLNIRLIEELYGDVLPDICYDIVDPGK